MVGLTGSAGQANYAAAKAGLIGLTRSLARELAARNITCNVVAPGPVATAMTDALPDDRRAELTAAVPHRPVRHPARGGRRHSLPLFGICGVRSPAPSIPVDGGLGMGH